MSCTICISLSAHDIDSLNVSPSPVWAKDAPPMGPFSRDYSTKCIVQANVCIARSINLACCWSHTCTCTHYKYCDNKWEWTLAWATTVISDLCIYHSYAHTHTHTASPTFLPCSLFWQESNVLLVGRGHIVKVSNQQTNCMHTLYIYTNDMTPAR